MKINWHQNPLRTTIDLDEHEKKEFWYKIKIEQLEERMYEAYFTLSHLEWYNKTIKPRTLEEAAKEVMDELDPDYVYSEDKYKDKGLDARVNELYTYYLEELQSSHMGDCTCFACSCGKCHVESVLGIDTIKGLGKHSAYKVQNAFSNGRDADGKWLPEKSLDEAIESLRGYDPQFTDKSASAGWKSKDDFDKYVPRWKNEAAAALEWLEKYKAEHFSDHDGVAGCIDPAQTQDSTPAGTCVS